MAIFESCVQSECLSVDCAHGWGLPSFAYAYLLKATVLFCAQTTGTRTHFPFTCQMTHLLFEYNKSFMEFEFSI